jgi:hypothetical protein
MIITAAYSLPSFTVKQIPQEGDVLECPTLSGCEIMHRTCRTAETYNVTVRDKLGKWWDAIVFVRSDRL